MDKFHNFISLEFDITADAFIVNASKTKTFTRQNVAAAAAATAIDFGIQRYEIDS